MADTNDAPGRRRPARALTEQALHAEQMGDREKAEELLAEAERIDPEEALAVIQEQNAGSRKRPASGAGDTRRSRRPT
ncbi:MAG TPA: hypothetical protein VGM42_08400 [Rhodopila sp.]|jgi:hypothetical protein